VGNISNRRTKRLGAVGAAAAGLTFWVLSELAAAPSAHADDAFTEMVDNVQLTITLADNAFAQGAADFANGDLAQALNFDLAGFDSLLFGPSQIVFLDSVDALTNVGLSDGVLIGELQAPPTDWADAVAQVQGLVGAAQSDFAAAAIEFTAGDYGFATGLDISGADFLLLLAPNELVIGAAESLFGF
jgi:hypothetical protein